MADARHDRRLGGRRARAPRLGELRGRGGRSITARSASPRIAIDPGRALVAGAQPRRRGGALLRPRRLGPAAGRTGATHAIGAGDAICALAGGPAHTLIAGDDGLDVLAFGEDARPPLVTSPTPGCCAAAPFRSTPPAPTRSRPRRPPGPLEVPAPRPPARNVVATADAPFDEIARGKFRAAAHDLGARDGLGAHRPAPRRAAAGQLELPSPPARRRTRDLRRARRRGDARALRQRRPGRRGAPAARRRRRAAPLRPSRRAHALRVRRRGLHLPRLRDAPRGATSSSIPARARPIWAACSCASSSPTTTGTASVTRVAAGARPRRRQRQGRRGQDDGGGGARPRRGPPGPAHDRRRGRRARRRLARPGRRRASTRRSSPPACITSPSTRSRRWRSTSPTSCRRARWPRS